MPCSGKDEGFDEPACACRSSGASSITPCMTISQRTRGELSGLRDISVWIIRVPWPGLVRLLALSGSD
jgi:hypothetical protein